MYEIDFTEKKRDGIPCVIILCIFAAFFKAEYAYIFLQTITNVNDLFNFSYDEHVYKIVQNQ